MKSLTRYVDPRAAEIASQFLRKLDAGVPGLVERILLTGSALFDDWQTLHSDVDVVFVVKRLVPEDLTDALAAAHAATIGQHCVDGVYLTDDQLLGSPAAARSAPQVVDGVLTYVKSGGQLTPVTWLEMSQSPVGRLAADHAVAWRDQPAGSFHRWDELVEFCRGNLASYWAALADSWTDALDSGEVGAGAVPGDVVIWTVLGPSRLVATIETRRVISKTEAGRFVARRWPDYASLAEKCIRARAGSAATWTVQDARDAVQVVRLNVEAGQLAGPAGG